MIVSLRTHKCYIETSSKVFLITAKTGLSGYSAISVVIDLLVLLLVINYMAEYLKRPVLAACP